jgi:hypothetical protein
MKPHEAGALDERRNFGLLPHGFQGTGVAGQEQACDLKLFE